MSRLIGLAILFGSTLPLLSWQEPSRPNFSGSWQLDHAKSNTGLKDDMVWKIDHKLTDVSIEEISGSKTLSSAKCTIAKPCTFEDNGRKSSAMTYFLESTLVQIRSTSDNSSVVKRQLTMDGQGVLKVELITIVPSDKTEVLVFTKQNSGTAVAKPALLTKTGKE